MTANAARPGRQTLALFLFFILVSGGASVAIRFTYAEIPTFFGAALRFFIGALFFWGLALWRRLALPKGRALWGAILYGVTSMGIPFVFIYWGLVKTPASLYQTLMATVPLVTLFLAMAQGLERFRWKGLLGALLSVAGIAIAVGASAASGLSLLHILGILLAAAGFAEAGIVVKKFPRVDPVMMNAIGMSVGSAILAIPSLLAREPWGLPSAMSTWLAFGYIVVFVTVIGFFVYVRLLAQWTASGVSYSFVLIPLVTVVLAATLAGEAITPGFLLGGVLVLVGVLVGALLPDKSEEAG